MGGQVNNTLYHVGGGPDIYIYIHIYIYVNGYSPNSGEPHGKEHGQKMETGGRGIGNVGVRV